jgi:endonuclease III
MDQPSHASKQAFNIDIVIDRIRDAVKPFPKAAMFELADDGYDSVFEQLVACLISVRTRDEVSVVAAHRLFAKARTPADMAALSPSVIDAAIPDVTFHERKAVQIREIAKRIDDEFGGELPCDNEIAQSFAGIGPKCANLALGIACMRRGVPVRIDGHVVIPDDPVPTNETTGGRLIAVDIHVHRVTNRWGYVSARTPEQTMVELQRVLPRRYDVEINALLVPFGKHVCTGVAPKCSTCPVLEYCKQVDVTSHR